MVVGLRSTSGKAGFLDSGVARFFALIALFNGAFALWLIIRPASHSTVVGVDNVLQFLGPLLVFPFCIPFYRLRLGARRGDSRLYVWSPILLGLGPLCYAVGQIIYTVYEQVLNYYSTPLPSWADPWFLSAYPCMLLGILWLPNRRLPAAVRGRLFLDSLMVMIGLVTFSWYFILGPTIMQGADSVLGQVVGTAYPLADLVLISCLIFLSAHAADPALARIVRTLWLALVIIVATDTVFDYQNLHGTWSTGHLVPDVGWPLGYMLVGAAAFMNQRRQATVRETRVVAGEGRLAARPALWRSLLPYVILPALAALILYAHHAGGDPNLEAGVYIGSAALVLLVLVRQILAFLENQRLYASLYTAYDELEGSHQALTQANARLEALATTDPLTGLPNHRALIASLDREIERARRYTRPCSILFLDLDHFKALNDGFGHQFGDSVLSSFAQVARRTLRGVDVIGRWGGEEFMAILPETGEEAALSVAEKVRSAVAAFSFGAGGGTHLTCSVGAALYDRDGDDRDSMIASADKAMYAAKSLGRNQVRCAAEPAVAALAADAAHSTREDAALTGTVEALATLVEARGSSGGADSMDVSRHVMQMALISGLPAAEARMMGMAGRVYAIGKVGVPDAILRKPGSLTADEWEVVRRHVMVGEGVLGRVPALRALAPIIRSQHERWDGRGYPDHLIGEQIPLGARILAVAAAYRAMTTTRPHKEMLNSIDAMAELRKGSGHQFDPRMVEAFERMLALESDRVGLQAS